MTLQNNTQYIEEDKIDLRELFSVLKRRKKMICSVTALFTLLSLIYIFIAKPVYSGNATLEIGQVINEQYNDGKYSSLKVDALDNINNLRIITNTMMGISSSIPKKTNLLVLNVSGEDKEKIKSKLEETITYILDRHENISKFYSGKNAKVKMTQLVGDISIENEPIKPKKKLIVFVAFITGLMLSIFLAFFLEFLRGMKEEEN
jgi:capsular polysaccharide biosynthesis protein